MLYPAVVDGAEHCAVGDGPRTLGTSRRRSLAGSQRSAVWVQKEVWRTASRQARRSGRANGARRRRRRWPSQRRALTRALSAPMSVMADASGLSSAARGGVDQVLDAGQGGTVGHVGGVSQAQRVLYGRRPLAGVGHARRSGAERGCTSTSAPAVPAPAVAGLDGPIAAPAPRVDPVRRGPGTRSRSGSGHLGPRPSASRLIAGAGPPRQRRNQSGSWRSSGQCRLAQRGPGPAP